jgi:hypothetical protein
LPRGRLGFDEENAIVFESIRGTLAKPHYGRIRDDNDGFR